MLGRREALAPREDGNLRTTLINQSMSAFDRSPSNTWVGCFRATKGLEKRAYKVELVSWYYVVDPGCCTVTPSSTTLT